MRGLRSCGQGLQVDVVTFGIPYCGPGRRTSRISRYWRDAGMGMVQADAEADRAPCAADGNDGAHGLRAAVLQRDEAARQSGKHDARPGRQSTGDRRAERAIWL